MEFLDNVLDFIVEWPIPILLGLTYLAGLVVSIVLIVKSKAKAATLSAVAFGLLLLMHVFANPVGSVLVELVYDLTDSDLSGTFSGGLNCCCDVLLLAAIVCLVVAIQQAISPSIPKEVK